MTTASKQKSPRVNKPQVAVHKFSSCDGCQLAFLNAGDQLVELSQMVDIVHFAEAGPMDELAAVDIAFVEGSISTPEDIPRIKRIRECSRYLVTIGACATSGGLQALRNLSDSDAWTRAIYAQPDYISSLTNVTPISSQVKVDLELWGCPINAGQVFAAIRSLMLGVIPSTDANKVCLECKRQQLVCVMVARGEPCMGPVTHTGCGALCPSFGRECYGCYGPAESSNAGSLAQRFEGLGLPPDTVARRFLYIHSTAKDFSTVGDRYVAKKISGKSDDQA